MSFGMSCIVGSAKGRKSVPQRPPGRLVPIPPAIAPFHRIGIDLLGRFPKSAHGNKWIIVCTDYSTRYAITKALPTAEVDEIAKFLLEEIVLRHGAPRVIITDRGAVFRSRLVSSLVDLCNIDHRFTTAYHPGDLVWVYTPVRKVGLSEKLLRRYFGRIGCYAVYQP
ncbi:transposon Ty3-I Gag-Pol polyprotein [Trichonephila clavipes]|nr:transposon Ty3-I Gag-Pol polyprotein [Trichonephila clavipes]